MVPSTDNRNILQISLLTPSREEKESGIKKITLNLNNNDKYNNNNNNPMTITPLFKIKPALDLTNGALYVRGDTLIVFNDIHEIGQPFIQIIQHCSSPNKRSLRKSVYGAPTIQDIYAIVMDDVKEERFIIESFVHKYAPKKDFPSYLHPAIHQFYQAEILVIILRGSLESGDVLFVMMELDQVLNDNEAKRLNQIPVEKQIKQAGQM